MRAWARDKPSLIYVDLSTATSYAEGVRAVADAIGYATQLSEVEERARRNGNRLPDLTALGSSDLAAILAVFKRACRELLSEGRLVGMGIPTLVLDHSTRPLTLEGRLAQERVRDLAVDDLDLSQWEKRAIHDDTLIRIFFDAAKGSIVECQLVIVTSDIFAEQRAIACESTPTLSVAPESAHCCCLRCPLSQRLPAGMRLSISVCRPSHAKKLRRWWPVPFASTCGPWPLMRCHAVCWSRRHRHTLTLGLRRHPRWQ